MKTALFDLSVVAGIVAIAYAGWLVAPPLAWLTIGVALAAFGIMGELAEGRASEEKKEVRK